MNYPLNIFKRKGKKQPMKNEKKIKANNNNNYFCCPKCNKGLYISLDPTSFLVSYKCQNNHRESNIKYNNFYNDTYIKQTKYLCQQCKKEKTNISCDICHIQVCNKCISEHNSLYSHKNFSFIEHSNKKCFEHNNNITQYCDTCGINLCLLCIQDDGNNSKHKDHKIIEYLIPNDNEIENYEKFIANKNMPIINKLYKWKENMSSLVDNIIENLNCEIMIGKLIFNNFKFNYLDINNYSNYKNVLFNSDKINLTLKKFMNSKTFKEETNILTNYFFGKNIKNKSFNKSKDSFLFINEDENKNYINNFNNSRDFSNISNISKHSENNDIYYIKENLNEFILSKENRINGNPLLVKNKYIYICNLEKNEISKIDIYKNNENNENGNGILFDNHKLIFQNIINLKNSLSKKMNYNILLWNDKSDLTKLLNLLNDKKIENKNNKKSANKINIGKNKIIEENKNYDSDNISNNNSDESLNSLLNKENSNLKNSNPSLFNTGIRNNKLWDKSYINFNRSEPINEIEIDNGRDKVGDVYISNTGKKYHSKSTCRKMKLSIKVNVKEAEKLGKTQCTLCKFD